jgi:glycerophosphoryl diester phosphodiesterase
MAIHVQAHRGACAELMENSRPAFRRAFEIGVDRVELDIHRSRDGHFVIFHDEAFNPKYSHGASGKLTEMTLKEIQAVDFLDPRRLRTENTLSPTERKIPTLEDLFQLAAPFSATLDIEIKKTADPKGFVAQLMETLRKKWKLERTIVRSFDLDPLSELRKLDKKISLAYLTELALDRFHEVVGDIHPEIWAPRADTVTKEMVSQVHQKGMRIIPWTVNEPTEWARLIKLSVDGITTDDPTRLKKFIGKS